MTKEQIIKNLNNLGQDLSNNITNRVKENDKTFAIIEIEDTISDLLLLINEIINL